MRIFTKLLCLFIPIIVLSNAVVGILSISAIQSISDDSHRLVQNIEQLQRHTEAHWKTMEEFLTSQTKTNYEYLGQKLAKLFDQSFIHYERLLLQVAQSPLTQSFINAPSSARELVAVQLSAMGETAISQYSLAEVSLLNTHGIELFRTATEIVPDGGDPDFDGEPLPNRRTDESDSPWFRALLAESNSISSLVYFEDDYGISRPEPVVSLSCPLRYLDKRYHSSLGETKAYLRISVPIKSLCGSVISEVSRAGIQVFVADSSDIVVAHSNQESIGQKHAPTSKQDRNLAEFTTRALGGEIQIHLSVPTDILRESTSHVRLLAQYVAERVAETRQMVSSSEHQSDITLRNLLVTIVGGILLSISATFFASRRISRPITQLSRMANLISAGDLDTQPLLFKGENEISVLSRDLDEMRKKLQVHIRYLDVLVGIKTRDLQDANTQLEREVAERKKTEESLRVAKDTAEKANRAKSEFLANMSHELRTPLHGILSFARFGLKKKNQSDTQKLKRYLTKIVESGQQLLCLLNDLLDLAKLESGKMTFEFVPVELSKTIREVSEEFYSRTEELDLKITILPTNEDLYVQLDVPKIKQMFRNVIDNAIKYSPRHGRISIELQRLESHVIVTVKDEGIGIPLGELNKVFDKFVQSSKTRTGAGGTGLGLPICKEIIAAHGGRIWAKAREQHGACIVVEFPLDSATTRKDI